MISRGVCIVTNAGMLGLMSVPGTYQKRAWRRRGPLSAVNRTLPRELLTSVFDPLRTFPKSVRPWLETKKAWPPKGSGKIELERVISEFF